MTSFSAKNLSSNKLFSDTKQSYSTIIEVNDPSGCFISYWNLSLKTHLYTTYCNFDFNDYRVKDKSLNAFNIKLIREDEINQKKNKLFTMRIHQIDNLKELNNTVVQEIKDSFENNKEDFIVILITMNNITDSIQKEYSKTCDKIKSKLGTNITDINILPYSLTNIDKLYFIYDAFLEKLKKKLSEEFLKKLEFYYELVDSSKGVNFDYIKNLLIYFELLEVVDLYEEINSHCDKNLFKLAPSLEENDKNIQNEKNYKPLNINKFDFNLFKEKIDKKTLTNLDFQQYIIYTYIKGCKFLKDNKQLIRIISLLENKITIFEPYFKTIFHFIYWVIHFIFGIIDYFSYFNSMAYIKNDDLKIMTIHVFIYLYNICYKYMKIYLLKKNIILPLNEIYIKILDCIQKKIFIVEEIKKYFLVPPSLEDENSLSDESEYGKFYRDYQEICSDSNKLNEIFFDNEKFIQQYLKVLENINIQYSLKNINKENSILLILDIIYLSLALGKFEDLKTFLVSSLKNKYLKEKQWTTFRNYICFVLILLLNFMDKNKRNLNLMFELMNTKFTKINQTTHVNDNYLTNDKISKIISDYLEEFNTENLPNMSRDNSGSVHANEQTNKNEIGFSLSKIIKMEFYSENNNKIFINKLTEKIIKMNYKYNNILGINFNIEQIKLVFRVIPNKKSDDLKTPEKNQDESDDKITSYTVQAKNFEFKPENAGEVEKFFEINTNDFKSNTEYKLIEIKFMLKNNLVGNYYPQEKIKLIFNNFDMKLTTDIFPSYNNPEINDNTFYYNLLAMVKIEIHNKINLNELNSKLLIIQIKNHKSYNDTPVKIQTEILKEKLTSTYKNIIIKDSSVEFPPGSFSNVNQLNSIDIPIFFENINLFSFDNTKKIKIHVKIVDNSSNEEIYSFSSDHKVQLIHLFNIGYKYKTLTKNSYLMQTTLSLNIDGLKVKVYNNENSEILTIDSKQAMNRILFFNNNLEDILFKIRQNYINFYINEDQNLKYIFCYPENTILEDIEEQQKLSYKIIINICNNNENFEFLKEIPININIKKYKESKTKMLINIYNDKNWSVIGKNRILEEFEKNEQEKNIVVQLLPLGDGFLCLPKIEFMDMTIEDNETEENNNKVKEFNCVDESLVVGDFEPIDYDSDIEGNKNVLRINPLTEYNSKINYIN